MLKTKLSIAIMLVAALSLLPAPAAYAAGTTGSFTAGATPTVDSIEIFSEQACTNVVTAMDPQTEYWARVEVSIGSNQLSKLQTVQVTLFYDASGTHTPVPSSGNVHTCAILTWTNGGSPEWNMDAGVTSTWQLDTSAGGCEKPTLTGSSGYFKFAFIPGTVATMSTGSADWDAQGKATRNPSQIGTLLLTGKDMNFYGEVSVTGTVDWGEVPLGLTYEDAANPELITNVNYIANSTYNQEIKSSATWTGPTDNVTLDETVPAGDPPGGAGEFALKADDTATLGTAVVVKATTSTVINASGTITEEAGNNVGTNNLWLSLSTSGITAETYTGNIFYEISH